MSLKDIVEISNRYGSDPEYVLAGGGNTSFKTKDVLFVKGSGTSLATITEAGFVRLDRKALSKIMKKQYSPKESVREAEVLSDMMAARLSGETGRPSVETLLHNLFEAAYVLHVHPAKVNGMTCGNDGKKIAESTFPNAIWVESTKPGYTLSALCKERMDAYKKKTGVQPEIVILQNHGIFFAADSRSKLDAVVKAFFKKLDAFIKEVPDTALIEADEERKARAYGFAPKLRMLSGAPCTVKYAFSREIERFSKSERAFSVLKESFSPDHIVYCRAEVLFLNDSGELKEKFDKYVAENGYKPKIVFLRDTGMFSIGRTFKDAAISEAVFSDAMKIAVYARSFGGAHHLGKRLTDFIKNWEVESYRSKVMAGSKETKRLSEKVSIVTGSAQGFGKGIAEAMLKEGAYVVIADMNYDGAVALSKELCDRYGTGRALPVAVNVSDEASVKAMIEKTVLTYGGLDVFVNNAGIARAGGLPEMTKQTFELVTAVNYTAYFLCVKYASEVMRLQHEADPSYMMDVIEINSKSGLSGSNKNFAYAGSKFGGIGLTQSFAMELAPYQIKVNAVCPGNYLDGPLWSDPVRGLFVQYLNAGKVPGAKNVDDVRKFYEAKVPLNRGCLPEDVARAIFYIVEQQYETGQALPVTGGQEMLK
ncbi:MAG: SDR family oxidoreductase [Lachnospiraceae bacterium]|nr:SDR family oxidoreductase [Lachnospiraceae bacterium]